MKTLTVNAEQMPWLDRFCRDGLFRTLKNLHTGCIRVYEGSDCHVFGDSHSDFSTDLNIHDSEAYRSIALNGSVGAGESYMTGDWSCSHLPTLIRILSRNKDVVDSIDSGFANLGKIALRWVHSLNRNTEKGSRRNIAAHYDLGNDMFALFLDPTMMYSSGIFPGEDATMEEASIYKIDRICRNHDLQP
ncbi:MAG: class I SAM-dependent methyltransferase, partial [Thalassolituus sp.]